VSNLVEQVVQAVATWDDVVVEPHRFGGQEFKVGQVEIGHVHRGGLVDVPFTRAIRQQLVIEEQAQPHHILPDSGWISFTMRQPADVEQALWLLRLSYVQKGLRRSRDAAHKVTLQHLLDRLHLNDSLRSLVG
jgi:hypothetical protein